MEPFQLTNAHKIASEMIKFGSIHLSCPWTRGPAIATFLDQRNIGIKQRITGDGWTALHTAAWHGHTELLGHLFSEHPAREQNRKSIDVPVAPGLNDTPLILAIMNYNVGCVELLLRHGARIDFVLDRSALWQDNEEYRDLHGKDIHGLIDYVASKPGAENHFDELEKIRLLVKGYSQ